MKNVGNQPFFRLCCEQPEFRFLFWTFACQAKTFCLNLRLNSLRNLWTLTVNGEACVILRKNDKFDHALYAKLLQDENDNIVLNDIPFPWIIRSAKMKLFGLSASKLQCRRNVYDVYFLSVPDKKKKNVKISHSHTRRKKLDIPDLTSF